MTNDELEVLANHVKELDRRQFKRLLQLRALEFGAPPPSRLGRLIRPARTERKLVLFTVGIVVFMTIAGVLALLAGSDPNEGAVTALTTLAGTGLGFIGGMVADRGDGPRPPESGEAPA